MTSKPELGKGFWDELGGCLFTGLMVSGVEVARARSRRKHGTWELLVLEICQQG
ncbi:hypothetical protein Atai01_83430 [Amycolatopsis taiwanensis]|uniref:Uncharacterized protein n=1 Tax=Amycolatopsis taiwanensis TaxID=342230 RepID=A0A9W6VLJ9_9PSEU|nr:hypothetical protein Atai01_83430 [Amycolatopsis taiwanensis]